MLPENWEQKLLELGMTRVCLIATDQIRFVPELRDICTSGTCGQSGRNWMCPPAVPGIDVMSAKVTAHSHALVLQSVHPLEDSFDFEGMMDAKKYHEAAFHDIRLWLEATLTPRPSVWLGAGACGLCESCTFPSGEPCRHPEAAMPSMEAFGVDVTALARSCGMPYREGPASVSYFGMVCLP